MAAYAAVISLKHTINGLLNSSRISLLSPTREILEFAHNQTTSLQQVLERFIGRSSSKWLHDLEGQIRDSAHKLEDVLEFHELNSQDEEVRQEIIFFVETVNKMETDYIEELSRDEEDDYDAAIVSSYIDFGVEMVGHSTQFNSIRKDLLRKLRPVDTFLFSFRGEDGSGRTVAAKAIFEDLRQFFDCCAWVTIGMKHQIKDVLVCILLQVDSLAAGLSELLNSMEDEQLCKHLNKILENQRCMIVLDDVRDLQIMEFLKRWIDYQNNGSLIIVTTSLKEVARGSTSPQSFEHAMKVDMSFWFDIRHLIFGENSISPELEEAGKKIVENCPCTISAVKTLLFLLKSEKTVEQWSKIAADKENPIFIIADEISEISKIKTEMQSSNWGVDMDNNRRNNTLRWISECVDLSDEIEDIKRQIFPERFFSKMKILSLLGMAGIGKTTFARKLYREFSDWSNFDHYVWVTLGPKYKAEEILIDILAQIYPTFDKLEIKRDEKLIEKLCVHLSSKRCFIVLDDLWSKDPLHYLKNLFPDIKGKTLVTTRLAKVAKFGRDDSYLKMQLLDIEESWCLLCEKVFGGEGLCPPQLEKAGRKIAEKCDGLPLLILTVAEQLLKVGISEEYWNKVASGKEKAVFMNAHHQISKALLPSYQRLPQRLKPCFLYMGIFLERYEIPTSNLTSLYIAEGFLEPSSPQIVEDFVAECLSELVDESLVMEQRKVSDLQIKTCRLHSVFWHLANSQVVKNKFFHAMNSYDDCFIESIESQRRFCIRNSILLGLKDVQDSMASNTSAHSLLCVGPLQQYPVPLNFDMRLLRVMNALTIRLYEFPVEVVRLLHLRYLSLTCNGQLPSSISNLWKLEYLIVKRYMSIKSSQNSSPLPMEIWDLRELKHLQVMGGRLPNPKCGATLLKLSALLDVSAQSCTQKVLEMIPNLKRLGIRIELAPDDQGKSFHYLNRICHLGRLKSLKCVVVNPCIRPEVAPPRAPVLMFPSSLKELSLSGLGYPWNYMSIIGKLENLEVLKLKRYAFQGPKWEIKRRQFKKLKFLLVEDTNLVHWKVTSSIEMMLEHLCIKHCYKLQELPVALPIHYHTNIEIVDCSALTMKWAKEMVEAVAISQPKVHLSWIADTHQKDSQ